MASLIPEIAIEEAIGVEHVHGDPARRRKPRLRFWRGVVLFVAGLYFLVPLYAGLKFSLENDSNQLSLYAIKAMPSQTGFTAA
jgi:putative spermidine/putrescine transport system permease protein